MKKLRIIEVSGTQYEVGLKIGKFFKIYIQREIPKYIKKLENEEMVLALNEVRKNIKTIYPKYLDEVYGRADGAKVSRDAYLLMLLPELYNGIDGCTSLVIKNKEGILFAHNEDGVYCDNDANVLVKYTQGNDWVLGYESANRLLGYAFGFNSNGICYSSNYIYGTRKNIYNVSRYFMQRDAIFAGSIPEIIRRFECADIASDFSFNVVDMNKNKAVNIEKENTWVHVTNIEDKYARSNHYLTSIINDVKNESSLFRYKKANELIDRIDVDNAKIEDLLDILCYYEDEYSKCIFKDINKFKEVKDKSKTKATFTVDTINKKVKIYDYIGRICYTIDINSLNVVEEPLRKSKRS